MSGNAGGPGISSEGLDPRRRRLLFRSWHRGIREMDIVYGRFADAQISMLSDAELDAPGGTETPLPAALPLFATGLGIIGLVARRRKRQAAAV